MNYLCERATGPERTCDFRSGKVILQQPIERAQMEKLLKDGRTDVLRAFVSNRTRRKFTAFLVRKPDGTVGFEFEPRTKAARPARAKAVEPAPTKAKAAKATAPRASKATANVTAEAPVAKKSAKTTARKPAKSPPKRAAKAVKAAKSAKSARR
jgi:DNA topoisomerase-3